MANCRSMPAFGFPGWAMLSWVLVFAAQATLASRRRIMHLTISTNGVMGMLTRMLAPGREWTASTIAGTCVEEVAVPL